MNLCVLHAETMINTTRSSTFVFCGFCPYPVWLYHELVWLTHASRMTNSTQSSNLLWPCCPCLVWLMKASSSVATQVHFRTNTKNQSHTSKAPQCLFVQSVKSHTGPFRGSGRPSVRPSLPSVWPFARNCPCVFFFMPKLALCGFWGIVWLATQGL